MTQTGTRVVKILVLAGIFVVIVAAALFGVRALKTVHQAKGIAGCPEDQFRPQVSVRFQNKEFYPELSASPCARERGLSGRDTVSPDGMLFSFEKPDLWGFWMKDMIIPIDIIWIASDGTVLKVAADVSPDTYPTTFAPERPAQFVWELPAGDAKVHGFTVGTHLVIGALDAQK